MDWYQEFASTHYSSWPRAGRGIARDIFERDKKAILEAAERWGYEPARSPKGVQYFQSKPHWHRLCEKHSAAAFKRYEATAKANPGASVEFWERWYEPETARQTKDQLEHCGDGTVNAKLPWKNQNHGSR